ncbi:molybdopterin-synthase adenylyltransferase MoeB [Diaphorobacter sp. HDW4A]|uniref:HesA/MoeB/ThiF family protein n=1 Tax=Diaphorobacter sp. HDW4A TaxID=2714924 RepID=UPI00140D45DA|nr:molybdopterin-synthase adenylyltransferase MoeB [Diaphorobacter sp. HDW4A]QIL83521.1 molybdopterin-synthase adenylyltransferase MoeB [Diaphorobacter sp. HDW4A]
MNDDQLLRYSRHIMLDDISIEGQERILAAHALVIGAGGLGSPVALILAAAGVGTVTLVDDDEVDLTNLQRQIAHTTERVGMDKVESAKVAMLAINPDVDVRTVRQRVDGEALAQLVQSATVVLDCTDNYQTRHAINAACVQACKPLVSGAAIRMDGQISVFDPRQETSPCYACLFSPDDVFEEVQCSTMGVFAPMVSIIGSMQAAEALKLIVKTAGTSLSGRLLMLDGRSMHWTEMRAARDPECKVCGASAAGAHK